MTREEALKLWLPVVVMAVGDGRTPEVKEAVEMAIKALEQEPSYNSVKTEQEPCDDCISRQAVDDAIYDYSRSCDVDYAQIMEFIDKLPSVSPQPKMGHWTRELIRNEKGGCIGAKMICSECGNDNKHDEYMDYCPKCGCKMQEVEND